MSFLSKRKKTVGSVIISAILILIFIFDLFSYFEYKLQDKVYQKPTSVHPDIIVIGIDEESLAEFGLTEKWSRQHMADAINIINKSDEYKPAVIALDILYIDEREDKEADINLAEAAENGGNVVVAARYIAGDVESVYNPSKAVPSIVGYEKPFPLLAQSVDYGIVNVPLDNDYLVRGTNLRYKYNGEVIYSFPYAIYKKYMEYMGEEAGSFNEEKETYITYYGLPGDYKQASFSDIFDEDFDPEYFADCIVLIGPYATGLLDAYFTPISKDVMFGVEIHANTVQMLLEENLKEYAPNMVNILLFLFILLLGIVLAELLEIRILLLSYITLVFIYYFSARFAFNKGYIITLIYPLAALVTIYIYKLIYGYVLEVIEKQRVKNAFKKYVDPKLVDKLMESGEADSDAVGKKRNIAVLFVDVRGFTPMTEALKENPELIVKILNEYLELTSSAVFNNGGSVDKFIGDATMALFNGFVPLDDYVYKAVKAAWDIVQGASEVNKTLKEKYDVDVGFGVGVNCGEAIVGNLGPSFRKDYTAIGDTVNTAARLESNAKRSEVLISRYVYEIVKDRITAESVGEIPLKGKSIKLEVYSVTNVI